MSGVQFLQLFSPNMAECPVRILVAGCSYGGMAFVVNLLDLCLGKSARGAPNKIPDEKALKGIPIDIHIIDERDGYGTDSPSGMKFIC